MHPILVRIPVPGWNLPLVGKLDAIPIYSYGVMLGLSLVVGWYLTLGLAEREGLDRDRMANCYVVTALVAVLGARLAYVVTNPGDFNGVGDLLSFRSGGLVAYGGFLGGLVGSYVYLRRKGVGLLPWADVAVPSLASGLAITRIGCYLFGCDYGRPLGDNAPGWLKAAGTFPRWEAGTVPDSSGSPAWAEHVARKLIESSATESLPVHPTQLYESLVGLGLLALLLWVRKRQSFRGQVFFIATFAYGLLRFALELLRDDPERGTVFPAAAQHLLIPVCLALFAAGWVVGPSRSIADARAQLATRVAAFGLPVIAWLALRPESFAPAERIALSTSQLIGLASALIVAAMYWAHDRAAIANPGVAMALGIPGEDDEPEPRPKRKQSPVESPAEKSSARQDEQRERGDEKRARPEAESDEGEGPQDETGPHRETGEA